jgi:hypothetical protein
MRSIYLFVFLCCSFLFFFQNRCSGETPPKSMETLHFASNIPPDSGRYILLSVTTPVEIYNFTYDDEGRMTKQVIGQAFPSRISYTYDTSGNILSELCEEWGGEANNKWIFSWRESFTYNENGNKLTELHESNKQTRTFAVRFPAQGFYDTTGILPGIPEESIRVYSARKVYYTYNSHGKMLTQLWKQWGDDSPFNPDAQYYTYGKDGNRLTNSNKYLDENSWTNSNRYTYTYDKNGNKSSEIDESWVKNKWVNSRKQTYTYDKKGNISSELDESWQNNKWVNSSRESNTFDTTGNLLIFIEEFWENNKWVNSNRISYTYNINGMQLNKLSEFWENNKWVNFNRISSTYDNNGNKSTEKEQNWVNDEWENYGIFYYFHDQDGNTTGGEFQPGNIYRGSYNSFGLRYNFKRTTFDLVYPDSFEANYKFIPKKIN